MRRTSYVQSNELQAEVTKVVALLLWQGRVVAQRSEHGLVLPAREANTKNWIERFHPLVQSSVVGGHVWYQTELRTARCQIQTGETVLLVRAQLLKKPRENTVLVSVPEFLESARYDPAYCAACADLLGGFDSRRMAV